MRISLVGTTYRRRKVCSSSTRVRVRFLQYVKEVRIRVPAVSHIVLTRQPPLAAAICSSSLAPYSTARWKPTEVHSTTVTYSTLLYPKPSCVHQAGHKSNVSIISSGSINDYSSATIKTLSCTLPMEDAASSMLTASMAPIKDPVISTVKDLRKPVPFLSQQLIDRLETWNITFSREY